MLSVENWRKIKIGSYVLTAKNGFGKVIELYTMEVKLKGFHGNHCTFFCRGDIMRLASVEEFKKQTGYV